MNKNLLILCCMLLSNVAFSQMNGDYNYTIAVRGFSMMQMPKILSQKNAEQFTNAAFSGMMIKFNDNQFSYRLNGNYLKKNVTLVNNCPTCQEAEGKMTDYAFKIGFEKNLNFSRIQPYIGLDIGFRYNKFDGTLKSKNDLLLSKADVTGPTVVEASKAGFVAAPVIGIKINPIPQISIFAESSMDFFNSYERQETVLQDVNNTKTFNKYTKTEFLLNPVSVGIQFHLGRNR